MNRYIFPFLTLLAACPSSPFDATGEGDTGAEDTDPASSGDVIEAETIVAIPWKPELPVDGGISGAASQRGFWVQDVVTYADGTGTYSHVYRIPWDTDGDDVVSAADVVVATTSYTPRIVGMDGGVLSLSGAETGASDYEINRMAEPNESGDLGDLVELKLTFDDSGSTYWNGSALMDADGDGSADDLVAAGRAGMGKYMGVIAVVEDAPETGHLYSSDMDMLHACEDLSRADVVFGAMSVVADADGSVWVTCASYGRAKGYAEHRPTLTADPDVRVYGVSGWSMVVDPRGGVWLGSEGSGELVYASTDGTSQRYAMEGFPHFGASPAVVEVGNQIILAVGAMATGEDPASAVYLYDITETTDLDTLTPNRMEPEGDVLCLGGVNALVERSDGVYVASSGWLLKSQEGCGVQMWRILK